MSDAASPPRLFIARSSQLNLQALERSLTPARNGEQGGSLWQEGERQKSKLFETDHFRVLYAQRRLRSVPFILLFAAATIGAIYFALQARWAGERQLPIRFQSVIVLSTLTFAISAASALALARVSVVRGPSWFPCFPSFSLVCTGASTIFLLEHLISRSLL